MGRNKPVHDKEIGHASCLFLSPNQGLVASPLILWDLPLRRKENNKMMKDEDMNEMER